MKLPILLITLAQVFLFLSQVSSAPTLQNMHKTSSIYPDHILSKRSFQDTPTVSAADNSTANTTSNASADGSASSGTGAASATAGTTTDSTASTTQPAATTATTTASSDTSNSTVQPAATTTSTAASTDASASTAQPAATTTTTTTTVDPTAASASTAQPAATTTSTAASTDSSGSTTQPAATATTSTSTDTSAAGTQPAATTSTSSNPVATDSNNTQSGDSSNVTATAAASDAGSNNSNASANATDDDSSGDEKKKNETYKTGQSFLNRSSQQFIDPHGNTFDTVEYVKDLSPYAKEDIRDMNNPLKKDKALVGKPFYLENNITFDESPRIFHEIIETQISKVETPITQHSQYGLWKNWLGNKHYQDVSYSGSLQSPLSRPDEEKAEQIALQPKLVDSNHRIYPPKPRIDPLERRRLKDLVNLKNPLKKQIYATGYDHTFVRTDNEVVSELHNIADDVVQDIENYDGRNKKRKNKKSHY